MTKEDKLRKIIADPVLWSTYFCKITDKNRKPVPFVPTYHQKLLLRNFGRFNIVNKSRQMGITSVALLYSLYLTHTQPDTVCMIMSYSNDTANEVFLKLKTMYDLLDPAVKIKDIANNRKELILENRSRIVCCICSNSDKARGSTIRYFHMTEVSSMDEEKLKNQLVAIEAALTSDGQIVLESTSKGIGGGWYDLWMKAVNKESQYKPFFFSWVDDTKLFLEFFESSAETYKNIYEKYLTVDDLDEEEFDLYDKITHAKNDTERNKELALKKLMWRRLVISNNGKDYFRQEYPATAQEGFVVSGNNVFDLGKTQERINRLYCVKPMKQSSMELPPLMRKWRGDWVIWRMPKSKERFYAGVDTGEGIGSDNSVIEIIDQDGEQVFEFASNRIKPYEYADLVREVGAFYNMSLLVVEKASAGHTVVDKLYDGGHRYLRLYKYKEYDAKGKAKRKPGFQTSAKSRPIIINRFVEMFETGQVLINSRALLDEMNAFQLDDNGKQQAVRGAKDDRVMAFAMALEGLVNGVWYI